MVFDIAAYTADVLTAYASKGIEHVDGKGHPLRKSGDHNKPGWIEQREEMGWHVRGYFPARLYAKMRPSEDKAWWEFRRENFRPITKGPIRDQIKNVTRVFSGSNYAIKINEDTDTYIKEPRFDGGTFYDWMFSRAFEEMILDPNSCIVPWPVSDDFSDTTQQIDVSLLLVESPQIIDNETDFISWKAYEKSSLKKGGAVFYLVDTEGYYKIEETKGTDNTRWQITPLYMHNSGQQMHVTLGGIAESRKGRIIYKSFFEGYLPFANEALDQFSSYQVSFSRNAFPIRIQPQSKCAYSNANGKCYNGFISWIDPDHVEHNDTCPGCKGSGYAPPVYPGAVFEREDAEIGEQVLEKPIQYVTTPVESLKLMGEGWQQVLEFAKEAISQRYIQDAQSGKAKEQDREGEYAMIQVIAKHFFGRVMQRTLEKIDILRFPFSWPRFIPLVIVPTDYKLKDSKTLLEELKELGEVSTTSGIYTEKVRQFCAKEWGNDYETKRKNEIHILYDPIAIRSTEEQNGMKASGAISTRDCQRSAMAYHVIEMILIEKGVASLDQDFTWWKKELDKRLDEILPEPDPVPTFGEAFGDEPE